MLHTDPTAVDSSINTIGKADIQERNPTTLHGTKNRLRQQATPRELRVLDAGQWEHWLKYGYVLVPNAIDAGLAHEIESLACDFEGLDPRDQKTWHAPHRIDRMRRELSFNAGMIELYHHPLLWAARQAPRIYDAFVDVWGIEQLWVSIDRMNVNLPLAPGLAFKSFMHWDYDPEADVDHVQGVLAINDQLDLEVGGFQCIPEIYAQFADWRQRQSANWDWYKPDVGQFTPTPVPMARGDLLIFNSRLCHGIRPNRSNQQFRIAQYISMLPADPDNIELRQWRIRACAEGLIPAGYSIHGDDRNAVSGAPDVALSDLGRKLVGIDQW